MKEYEVHPAAAIFPMMSDEEIADLAADIKQNGLKQPIILGTFEGREVLVDGRNRLKACAIAGVDPDIEMLNGEDQQAYVISVNIKRRHLNFGQRAMAYAMVHRTRVGRAAAGESNSQIRELSDGVALKTFQNRVAEARLVLTDSRSAAEKVMDGTTPLDVAYREAKARQKEKDTEDEKRERLRLGAPDLLPLVLESRMSLDDAVAALTERERKAEAEEKSKREAFIRNSEALYRGALAWANADFVDEAMARFPDPEFRKAFAERVRVDPAEMDKIKTGALFFHDALLKLGDSQ